MTPPQQQQQQHMALTFSTAPGTLPSRVQGCHSSLGHLGAPSASRDLRWQPWAPGGCAGNRAADSLSMWSFQMEKAAVSRQLQGHRKEGLEPLICASSTVLGSSHRAPGEQRAQQEGQKQPRSETGKSQSWEQEQLLHCTLGENFWLV